MKRVAAIVFAGIVGIAAGVLPALAENCLSGGCHKKLTASKFLHGPVAAEDTGAEGCVSCHVPAGTPCTVNKAGQFNFKTKKDRICLLCHERGTATQHTRTRIDCLSCHNPHGSEQSMNLLRTGQNQPTKKP